MKTIAIVDGVTENKVEIIKIYRETAKVGLKEAKDAIDEVEKGTPALLEVEDSEAHDIIQDFTSLGVKTMIADGAKMVEAKTALSDTKSTGMVVVEEFIPIVPAAEVAKLEDRNMLKEVLNQVATIIKTIDDYSDQLEALQRDIKQEKVKMEEVRRHPPFTNEEKKITKWLGIGAAVLGFFIGSIWGAIILGMGVFITSRVLLTKHIVQNNSERCDDAANEYNIKSIKPLEDQLTGVNVALDELAKSGRVAWAMEVVGEDMFDAESVNILYHIIDGRRADTMKEALNKYDEEMYRRNMQAMQLAAQKATEAAAAEAVKQTNVLKNIEQSSKQTASAAQASTMINILDHSSSQQQKKLLKKWKKDGLI